MKERRSKISVFYHQGAPRESSYHFPACMIPS